MAKDPKQAFSPASFEQALTDLLGADNVHVSVLPDGPDIEGIITRVLENNITDLEHLRSSLERAGKKGIDDVRDFGSTSAGEILRGIEEVVDYDDLCDLIEALREGVARRRINLQS